MNENKNYRGIDGFRLAATLLVIAIHTSPLASFSGTADFILTRAIARIAVPFFFMTSGFFLLSQHTRDAGRLKRFLRKIGILYGCSILIYLPVNLYSGYFQMKPFLPGLIRDLAVDGTMYHLWYFPAAMLGAVLSWYLVRRFGWKRAMAMTGILYCMGVLGDSYWGMTGEIPVLKNIYDLIFQVCDYTRNGLFFAPAFFVMGGVMAKSQENRKLEGQLWGVAVSLGLLTGESLILRQWGWQRHDSMYLLLLPCSWFLFGALLHVRGKRMAGIRKVTQVMYVIHPMMILALRFESRVLSLKILVENSLVHYLAVCLASAAFALAVIAAERRIHKENRKVRPGTERAWREIDLDHLAHNVKELRRAMSRGCDLMAVLKTEAYGHGAFEIAACLNQNGVRAFAVATIDEGIRLRKYGLEGDILILGYTCVGRAGELKKYHLTQTLISLSYARELNRQGVRVKAHIKIDTGMHRLGIPAEESGQTEEVFGLKYLQVEGMFTHLCCSDSRLPEDEVYTQKQIHQFYTLAEHLKKRGITVPKLHMQSSYGLLNYSGLSCDYVRVGIALYGVLSSPKDCPLFAVDLRPVLSLKSRIALIRQVAKGESVGYGRSFTADCDSRIAILPVGYGDGYPRSLSNGKGWVLIRGRTAPVVGRICMDQMAVDVTDIPDVRTGDTVVLIGCDGNTEIRASILADRAGSISNELLCRLGDRLPVIVRGA